MFGGAIPGRPGFRECPAETKERRSGPQVRLTPEPHPRETAGPIAPRAGQTIEHASTRRIHDERDLSTKPNPRQADAWLSEENGDEGRPPDPEAAPGQRPQAPLRLTRQGLRVSLGVDSCGRDPEKPAGLSRRERIAKNADFTRILRDGRRERTRTLTAFWVTGEIGSEEPNRVGVAAGRRLGNAVLRNRLKRRLREAYRSNKGILPWRGVSIIFVAKREMMTATADDANRDMARALGEMRHSLG